jgi:hypothetical protein
MVSSSCYFESNFRQTHRHSIVIVWFRQTVTLSCTSSCYHHRVIPSQWHSEFYAPQTKILEGWTKDEIRMFDWLFNGSLAQVEYSRPWKVLRTSGFHLLFILPKSSFGRDKFPSPSYPSQTKILEGGTRNAGFWSTLKVREYSIWATSHGKVLRAVNQTSAFRLLFLLPKNCLVT